MNPKYLIACFFSIISYYLISCNTYYSTVRDNKSEFHQMGSYLLDNKIFIPDSVSIEGGAIALKTHCIDKYVENLPDNVIAFMKKYDVNRICFKERNDGYYNNVISFHKDYNPFFGKSRTIDYDFGQSPLRDRINAGMSREKSYKYKIIDSVLVYSQNSSPAFGE